MEIEVTGGEDFTRERMTVKCHTCGTSVEVSDTPFGHLVAQNFPQYHGCAGQTGKSGGNQN